MRPAVVLRPQPDADRTVAALQAAGLAAVALPLFAVRAVAWDVPAGEYDALVLTSANAVRHGGPGIAALGLPVLAVGTTTAAAARAAGLRVAATGQGGVAALLDAQAGRHPRLLHLAGRDRVDDGRLTAVTVYAADPLPVPDIGRVRGAVALLHSARAARRLAALVAVADRGATRLAALGPVVAAAAGEGWDAVAVAARPIDSAIVAAARRLAD